MLLVAAATLAACTRRKPTSAAAGPPPDVAPALGLVAIEPLSADVAHPETLHLDVQPLVAEARGQLRAAGLFAGMAPDAGTVPVARVRVEFSLEEVVTEKKTAARAATRLRIDIRPADGAAVHWNEDVQAASETVFETGSPVNRNAVFQKLVSRTIHDLLAAYVVRQKAWTGQAPAVHLMATDDARETRLEAIRAIGARRIESEAPMLLRLLSDDDEDLRDAALGALVEMRDRRAVNELGKSRSLRDVREMRKILDAIATLGGDDAVAYLSFVADAHEDEEIRKMAKEAGVRLQRRADAEKAAAGK